MNPFVSIVFLHVAFFLHTCSQKSNFAGGDGKIKTSEGELGSATPVEHDEAAAVTPSPSIGTEVEAADESPPVKCNLTASIVTTEPSSIGGNDASAKITVKGGNSKYTYEWSNGHTVRDSDISESTISNLPEKSRMTVVVTDGSGCKITESVVVGEFKAEADFILLTYQFLDGRDFDTRTRMSLPDVNQSNHADKLGWGLGGIWPEGPIEPFLTWGGDNTGTGFESVLIDLIRFKKMYAATTSITIDLAGFWYGSGGPQPVNVAAKLWKGGLPVGPNDYTWTNPTAIQTFDVESFDKIITLKSKAESTPGAGIAKLNYDLNTNKGNFSPF